jgi:hypothetical protein
MFLVVVIGVTRPTVKAASGARAINRPVAGC